MQLVNTGWLAAGFLPKGVDLRSQRLPFWHWRQEGAQIAKK